MTLYFALKFLHVIGASVLLGTGAGIAFFMLMAHLGGDPTAIAGVARIVVIADFVFTATAVVAQPLTGLALASVSGYPLGEGWIVRVAFAQVGVQAEVGGPLPGDGEHRRAQLQSGDAQAGRVERQVAAGADGHLEDRAPGAFGQPLSAAGEPVALEERDLPVVAGRRLVPYAAGFGGLFGPYAHALLQPSRCTGRSLTHRGRTLGRL